jgi:hypothetical protein
MPEEPELPQQMLAALDRVVSDAVRSNSILVSETAAERLARDFPGSGLSLDQISDRVIEKAIRAGVGLQIGHAA